MTLFPRAHADAASADAAAGGGLEAGAKAPATRTGLPPRVLAVLAYVLWWVTGGLLLVIEPDEPFVRFHARQAFRVFGLIWLIGIVLWGLGLAVLLFSMAAFRLLAPLGQSVWLAGVVLWVVAMVQAWRGRLWAVPWLGRGLLRTDN